MKKTIIVLIILIILGVGAYFVIKHSSNTSPTETTDVTTTNPTPNATTTQNQASKDMTVIGQSVQGNDITAYHYGTGATNVLIVGGMHGGYEWNTALLANQLMDYFKANPNVIPKNIRVTIIPALNPDGLKKVVGTTGAFTADDVSQSDAVVVSGRFNANNVDLNRNFDCDWKRTGVWQDQPVSGGTSAFSEPESAALEKYVETNRPDAVIALFSSAGGVYSSSCGDGISAETTAFTNAYAKASGYPAHKTFDSYETSGDMTNWLAKNSIPAISVLLTNHTDTEFDKNLAGMKALFDQFAQ